VVVAIESKAEAFMDEEGRLGALILGALPRSSLDAIKNSAPPRKTAIIKIGSR